MSEHTNMRYVVLKNLRDFMRIREYAPSYAELAALCGIRAKSTVLHYLRVLEVEGLVVMRKGHQRSLHLTELAEIMNLPSKATQSRHEMTNHKKAAGGRMAAAILAGKEKTKRQHEQDCFEQAVALGKTRDGSDDLLHDRRGLFSNGRVRASKVG